MFGYADAIVDEFPTIRAGLVHATALTNGTSPAPLTEEYAQTQHVVAKRLADTTVAELSSIAAWRRVFTRFGAKPTQYRCAAEALLRRLTKQGDIPSISTLVDIGNLVSIRYAMPVAVFDRDGIAGTTTVKFAAGDEKFTDLGSTEITHPEPGEVIFVDADDVVSARRWCWRQSADSATSSDTTEAVFVVEGHHDEAERDVKSAIADLLGLLAAHQPQSNATAFHLSPARTGTGSPEP